MKYRIAKFLYRVAEWLDPYHRNEAIQTFSFSEPMPKPTARDLVDSVLDRPIEWVAWSKFPPDARAAWGNDARAALDNVALQSLIGKSPRDGGEKTNGELVKRIIEAIARRAASFEEVRDLRMTINGIELVRECLEDMLFQEGKETVEEPNATI